MHAVIPISDGTVTIYTDANMIKSMCSIMKVPPFVRLGVHCNGQQMVGYPREVIDWLQGILYEGCKREGFPGLPEFEQGQDTNQRDLVAEEIKKTSQMLDLLEERLAQRDEQADEEPDDQNDDTRTK